jgi:hypothetical protein
LDVLDRASEDADTKHAPADPEGGAHGCAPFSDLATDGESENPVDNAIVMESFGKGIFFGSFLLCLSKEMNSPFRAKRFALT